MNYKYIIIGNSAAAIGCIEGIRCADKLGTIGLFSSENEHTYSRPLISYLLCNKTTREKMKYRPDDFYTQNGVEAFFGKPVTKIDAHKHVVFCENNEFHYEKLLVATGSRPFIPTMLGLETVDNKFTFMSLEDAENLDKKLDKNTRVLIIGAGLIGLKCAEGIYDKVKNITVVDMASRVLSSILNEKAAMRVQGFLENKGIKFCLSSSVSNFENSVATLTNGEKVCFDVLVIAVGVRANTELVLNAGGAVLKGIKTDLYCQTTLPDIYAAGDCSESFDSIANENRVLALLPNAYMQGECAGLNMAGGEKLYDFALAMNAIGFFNLHMITAGVYTGQEIICEKEGSYRAFYIKDNHLCGYILLGDILRAGIYTSLIRDKTPIDTVDFDLIKENPQLIAIAGNPDSKIRGV